MLRKVFLIVLAAVAVHAASTSTGGTDAVAMLFIPLECWILFRAWPSLRDDLRRLFGSSTRGRLSLRRFRRSRTVGF